MQIAQGQQILLLNNDCVVPVFWLERLLRRSPCQVLIGLVGPCSNFVNGEQQVEVDYQDLPGLAALFGEMGTTNQSKLIETDRLIGFVFSSKEQYSKNWRVWTSNGPCLLRGRRLCLARFEAGFKAVIAREAFVHHYGGRTFVGSKVPFSDLMEHNRQLFERNGNASAREVSRESRKETINDLTLATMPTPVVPPRSTNHDSL